MSNPREKRLQELFGDNYDDKYLKWYEGIDEIAQLDNNTLKGKHQIIYNYYLAHLGEDIDWNNFLNQIEITTYKSDTDLFYSDAKKNEYKKFLNDLENKWKTLNNKKYNLILSYRKKNLFNKGYNQIKNIEDTITFLRYDNKDFVNYKNNTTPKYFKEKILLKENIDMEQERINFIKRMTTDFYSYNTQDNNYHIWVDFANKYMGGGIFGLFGLVQEEIMCLEMPQLSALLYKRGKRSHFGADEKPRQFITRIEKNNIFTPTPIIVQNLTRVLKILAYGSRSTDNKSLQSIPNYYEDINKQKNINILAIAAVDVKEYLNKKNAERNEQYKKQKTKKKQREYLKTYKDLAKDDVNLSKYIIYDMFNTLVKGFEFAYLTAPHNKKIIINSGPFGSGDFKNDAILVASLHYIAQEYIKQKYNADIEVKLWGYTVKQQNKVKILLNNIIQYVVDHKKLSSQHIFQLLSDIHAVYMMPET